MQNSLLDYKVLFIEDDKEINKNITLRLKRYFKDVYSVFNSEDGYRVYLDKKPKIIFVDINLDGMDGIDLLRKIRLKDHDIKAVIITARSDLETILKATELKLTKYLLKPLTRKDLEDTIELLIKEINSFKVISAEELHFADNFSWNKNTNELFKDNKKVNLTATENKIFQTFISNVNLVLSYDDIILDVWDDYGLDKKETLKTTLKNLRKKLPKELIQNEYGIGYKLVY